MTQPSHRGRLLLKVGAILTTVTLLVAGCARAENPEKQGSGQAGESRVASVGLGDADTLLALGVQPVLVAPWGAEGDVADSGVGPWSEDLLKEDNPKKVFNVASGFTADVLEKISAADPSEIIAVNQAVDSQAKEALEAIAPTTVKPEGTKDWQVPWRDQVRQIAGAVEKESEGEQLIKDAEKSFEDFKKKHRELAGKKAAIVMPYEGKIGLYTSGDGRGQFIESLGFKIPKSLEGEKGEFYRDIAPENYKLLNDVDYLFVLDYQGAAEKLRKDPTFSGLQVVKKGKVRWLSQDTGNAMSMPNPVTIPWAVDQVDAAL